MVSHKIKSLVQEHADECVALRRQLRRYPEISGREFNTQHIIMAELTRQGLLPRSIAGTGVIAEVSGSRPGKRVAIRADMDALPLQDECGQPYRSQTPGVCHACGHDGHIALVLGAAKVLSKLQGEFAGEVRLLFQPSEEVSPGGAADMIQEGALDGVDCIIGAHLWQPLQAGTMGISCGRMLAAPGKFAIQIQGKGGHGSMPHQTVDPVLTAAQIVVALHTLVSRSIDPLEPAVLSVGMIKSGETFNIIPDTAVLKGTIRCFDRTVMQKIFQRSESIAKGICDANGAGCHFEQDGSLPALVNHPDVAKTVMAAGRETLGSENVCEVQPVMISDDFSRYLEIVPGAYLFIGSGNKEKGIVFPHHHPKFDLDETALAYGMEIMIRTVLKLLV